MINEDYTPDCFKTKQFSKGNGICKNCRKYRDCEIGIKIGMSGYLSKPIKGGQNGNNNSKKRR